MRWRSSCTRSRRGRRNDYGHWQPRFDARSDGAVFAELTPPRRLACAIAGCWGGLIALSRGEAHLAGTHLLDPETGEYNLSYIRRYLPEVPVVVVTLTRREQGFIVAPGNPKGIHGVEDLLREEVTYVNRQRGAGTRVLLDYMLGQASLPANKISGYGRE